ncbi:MAG: hypothetical protein M0R39_00685 [Prolixibacteraceae bacterium]|nr:hypothetical protein [Prolixibacteraceae bacterium]
MNWSDLKKRRRKQIVIFLGIMLPLLMISRIFFHHHKEHGREKIGFHQAIYDQKGKLLPWISWEEALKKEMTWYYKAPLGKSGYPVYFYSTFIDSDYKPYKTDIIPSTQLGMGILSYLKYWEFTGKSDSLPLKYAIKMGQFLIHEASTPNVGKYPGFPRSTGTHEDIPIKKSSQGDAKYGEQVIEPDKGGIAGYAYLKLFEKTGNILWKEKALAIASVLAENMRTGDQSKAPWPFRVDAITCKYWGERNGNMAYILRLWDGLIGHGCTQLSEPRAKLWNWIKNVQFKAPEDRAHSHWIQFFEDMTEEDNRNSWAPLEMARYLIEKKEVLDPEWKSMAGQCIDFAMKYFAIKMPGDVTLMGEQDSDLRPWGGACSKLGGVSAMFYAAGGGERYREIALRNLNWVTYFIDSDGGPAAMCDVKEWRKGSWQEDCHTDVVHNFIDAMNAVLEFRSL